MKRYVLPAIVAICLVALVALIIPSVSHSQDVKKTCADACKQIEEQCVKACGSVPMVADQCKKTCKDAGKECNKKCK
jgi:hypothetical protein